MISMHPICVVYNRYFHDLVEQHEHVTGENIIPFVEFILAEPPYTVRRNELNSNAAHDSFKKPVAVA